MEKRLKNMRSHSKEIKKKNNNKEYKQKQEKPIDI